MEVNKIQLQKNEKLEEVCINFYVITHSWLKRNYLYWNGKQIAECINGDYKKRFGGINGWLLHILNNRTIPRFKKIQEIKSSLKIEETMLINLQSDILNEDTVNIG